MSSKRRLAAIAGLALVALAGLRGRLRRYAIAESSMEPHLSSGDYVVAQRRSGPPDRGAAVIFGHPDYPTFELAKRVVGLPGESIVIRNGRVHIDGAVLAEPWADGPSFGDGAWQLGTDEVFVLGDNRAASAADSRTLGPIPLSAIGWRIIARYWPATTAGRITP